MASSCKWSDQDYLQRKAELLRGLIDLYEKVLGDLATEDLEAAELSRPQADALIQEILTLDRSRAMPLSTPPVDELIDRARVLHGRIMTELTTGRESINTMIRKTGGYRRALKGYKREQYTTGNRLDLVDTH